MYLKTTEKLSTIYICTAAHFHYTKENLFSVASSVLFSNVMHAHSVIQSALYTNSITTLQNYHGRKKEIKLKKTKMLTSSFLTSDFDVLEALISLLRAGYYFASFEEWELNLLSGSRKH